MDALAQAEDALSQDYLDPRARAFLLLQLCQLATLFQQPEASRYRESLTPLARHLDSEDLKTFKSLIATSPSPPSGGKGLAAAAIREIDAALAKEPLDARNLRDTLRGVEARLRQRWYWPFGLGPAWKALLHAWGEVDRRESLRLLRKVADQDQLSFLTLANREKPLTPQEWTLAAKGLNQALLTKVTEEILDAGQPLNLPPALALPLARDMKNKILAPWGEGEVEAQREATLFRLEKWVAQLAADHPEIAVSVLSEIYAAACMPSSTGFTNNFPKSFARLGRLIRLWTDFFNLHEAGLKVVKEKTPEEFRGFALSHWHGLIPTTREEAEQHYRQLMGSLNRDKELAEAWYVILLAIRGHGREALDLASRLPARHTLVPRVRRAIVCQSPRLARELFSPDDFRDDPIGLFFFLPLEEKLEFLRKNDNVLFNLWICPSMKDLKPIISGSQQPVSVNATGLFLVTTPAEEQFRNYVRMNGYGYYSYGQVDRELLVTLLAWEKKYPHEIEVVVRKLLDRMNPPSLEYTIDILRNIAFERIRTVISVHPRIYIEEFVDWLKKKFVDFPYSIVIGDTRYTLQFKSQVPLLYVLLAAENIAAYSAKKCDELIEWGLRRYTGTPELVRFAAGLYALDKGLAALRPLPMHASLEPYQGEWQIAVIKAAKRDLVESFLSRIQGGTAPAGH